MEKLNTNSLKRVLTFYSKTPVPCRWGQYLQWMCKHQFFLISQYELPWRTLFLVLAGLQLLSLPYLSLFYFFMNCHFLQDGVVLFQLHTLWCIFPVLGGNIPWCAGHSAGFVFSTLQNDLPSCFFIFLGHALIPFKFWDGKIESSHQIS